MSQLSPCLLLEPFLQVIKSGETGGRVTGIALNSIQTFLDYHIIDVSHPEIGLAIHKLAHSVTRCKFEATDAVSDEVTLHKILKLLRCIVSSQGGIKWLDDKGICEIVEVAFGMYFKGRVSELLRKSAQETLFLLTQVLFERLASIENGWANAQLNAPKTDLEILGYTAVPFGLGAIAEYMRVLIALIDPHDHTHSNTLHRPLALELLSKGFEIGGQSLAKLINQVNLNGGTKKQASVEDLQDKIMSIATDSDRQGEIVYARVSSRLPSPSLVHVGSVVMEQDELTTAESVESNQDVQSIAEEVGTDQGQELTDLEDIKPEQTIENQFSSRPEQTDVMDATHLQDIATEPQLEQPQISNSIPGTPAEQPPPPVANIAKLVSSLGNMVTLVLPKHLFQILLSVTPTFETQPPHQMIRLVSHVLNALISAMHAYVPQNVMMPQLEWLVLFLVTSCEAGIVAWDIQDWASTTPSTTPNRSSAPEPKMGEEEPRARQAPKSMHGQHSALVPQIRLLYMESLVQLLSPGVFARMYVFFDTSITASSFVFERLMGALSKWSFPDITPGGPMTVSAHQLVALDGLLVFLRAVVTRRNETSQALERLDVRTGVEFLQVADGSFNAASLAHRLSRKRAFEVGVEFFNKDYKQGIQYFQQHAFITSEIPSEVARLFRFAPRLSKQKIGEYIAKPKHTATLSAFAIMFDFSGLRIDQAMRVFLETFRIPGEAQQIERIIDQFSACYFETIEHDEHREIASGNDTAVLAFSIIMLNTDQHNPQVRNRMQFKDYCRNVRGLNNGKDFNSGYLKSIYDAIKENEIVLAEEHGGQLGFNHLWRKMALQQEQQPKFNGLDTNMFDRDLFSNVWAPVVAGLLYQLENAEESMGLQKALVGLQHVAILAVQYERTNILDYLIISLCRLAGIDKPKRVLDPEDIAFKHKDLLLIQEVDVMPASVKRGDYKLDRWVIDLGASHRSQMCAVLMMNLVTDFSAHISEAWDNVQCFYIGNSIL